MNGMLIPIVLAVVGLIAALFAYRGIQRGGARQYTLEREAMLRGASRSLLGSVLLFLAAIAFLIYSQQQAAAPAEEPAETDNGAVAATITMTPAVQQFPPTDTPSPTVDPNIPTPTATAVVCRAAIEETGGSGLTLRDAPGGEEVRILAEGTVLTVLPDEPQEVNNFVWRRVRVIGGDEGWVAEQFLSISAPCE
jgi:hypothetical protein